MRFKHCVTDDVRWYELAAKYQNNWVKACHELFGITLTPQQRQIIDVAEAEGGRTTIAAGGGVGTHTAIAAVAILRVILFRYSRVVLVRPTTGASDAAYVRRCMETHWKKLLDKHKWLDIYFKHTDTAFHERTSDTAWGMVVKSSRMGSEESLAGECGREHLTIVLHAAAVSDKAFSIITSGLTEPENALLMLSMPSREEGYFYDSHHQLNKVNGGIFTSLILNAEDSPLVSSEFIEAKRQEYGGPDSDEYRMKVQGRFPLKGKS